MQPQWLHEANHSTIILKVQFFWNGCLWNVAGVTILTLPLIVLTDVTKTD